uniref:Uncharacterized protein n=1 Tax=Meloidogyne hapla TaxID=6305 RepID=A0A1I8B8D8_MELHA
MYNFGGIVQGCGECPSNKIPCRTCTKTACNKFKLINEDTTFCWEKEVIRACDINACHYAVINESIVLQGCGEKCPDNKESEFCKYCTTRNCNEEKLISKYCFTNNGKIETKGDIPCFMERTKTNEVNKGFGQCPSSSLTCKTCNKNLCNDGTDLPYSYCLKFDGKRAIGCDKLDYSKAGCGTCDENNIEKSCFDCKGLNCNEKSKLEKAVFCYEREENGNEKEGSRPCNSKICFISVDINKGSGSSKETILKKYTKQGCGTCSSTKIPCRTCNKDLCNTEKYFQEVKFCWIKEYAVECDLNKWNGFCYYTLKKDKVEQGCGNGSKIEFDVLNVKCDQQLCNTKELFDKTLFCLNKGKDEKTNKAIICKENCKVERNYEGKVEQKCGNCPNNTNSTDCNSCKGRFCNEEKLVYKHCLKNNGEICKTPFDSPCFMARIEGNEVSQGCGNCNKSTKSTCKECVTHRCNNPENVYFCKSKEGVKECTDSYCYIANNLDGSKDFNCGKCPEEIQTNCAQCNNNPLCNTEELLKNSFYCLEFTEVMQTMMEGFIGCESQCYVKRKTSGRSMRELFK